MSVKDDTIKYLLDGNYIDHIIGKKPIKNCGLVVWARHSPKPQFAYLMKIANMLSDDSSHVFIDDICSQIVTGYDVNEQQNICKEYDAFFSKFTENIHYSSDLLQDKIGAKDFFEFISTLTVNEYMTMLPEKKKMHGALPNASEFIHTFLEEMLFREARSYVDTIVIGKFSLNMAYLHRRKNVNSLQWVVVPRLEKNQDIFEDICTEKVD